MSENIETLEPEIRGGEVPLRDEDGHIDPNWIETLHRRIEAEDGEAVVAMMEPLHAADTGDVLEALDAEARLSLVRLLGDKFDFEALTEVDESVRNELFENIPNAEIARGVAALDSDSKCMCDWAGVIQVIDPGQERVTIA